VIERSAVARCSPEALMDKIRRPATWPEWQSEIVTSRGPEVIDDGDVVSGRARMMGFDVDGQSVTEAVDGSSLSQDVVVGVGMRIRYTLTETPEGTTVTHRLESDLPEGALGRLLSFFLRRRLQRMQKMLLEELVAQAEASSD
jgi:Polyketide cyclase / dehydrase and lipid transport